jgi:tripartite-type tricarboxylate transporter receptor subunit TctC
MGEIMKRCLVLIGIAMLVLAPPLAAQDFPAKGRIITMIVPNSAGGGTDTAARLFAPLMEKDLGVRVDVVNKPGAGTQIGLTMATAAKPDGYTLVWTVFPATAGIYLDPDRKAAFGRKDLQPIAIVYNSPFAVSVLASSPYKTLRDLIDAAKANPGKVKGGTTGFMTTGHFANIGFQRATGAKLAMVNFDGGGPQLTALLGGHIDASFNSTGELLTHVRAGTVRVLGILGEQKSDFLPDVKTLKAQGYASDPVGAIVYVGVSAPAGVPAKIVDMLANSLHKAMGDEQVKKTMVSLGNELQYLSPKEFAAFWDDFDVKLKPLIEIAKQEGK